MKTLVILFAILYVALFVRATVVPAEAAAVQQEDKPAPNPARFDFCLDGWQSFQGNCYYLANHADSWRNAENLCASYGSSLASAHDIWEYSFLQRFVRTGGHTFAWIGGYYFQGDWRWEDGSVFGYHNWETAGSADQYQCLLLNSQESKGFSNHGCEFSFPFVCQHRPNC
ncbi:snaclec coagulation factor IX/factor X-binding protein subunit B3-like isoform X2 [Pempheris klunzingeri]|uniref:snaclec coagulation factor IX/factor X-binding protein subunit B3-like isoform X2 n=1 Tax=Pempheris klunzingeri TaxID=3127111 RepID=UPI00397E9A64